MIVVSDAGPLMALAKTAGLGRGEEESILLAIESGAIWLLVDDLDARRAAVANFEAAGVETRVKGSLGIVLSAYREGRIAQEEAIGIVTGLNRRPDIWISSLLCEHVLAELESG